MSAGRGGARFGGIMCRLRLLVWWCARPLDALALLFFSVGLVFGGGGGLRTNLNKVLIRSESFKHVPE